MEDDDRVPDRAVAVVDPDPRWPARFAEAAEVLRRVLPEAMAVEHIGSTAVPGLVAMATVDVLLVIDDLRLVRERAPALAVAGYDLRLGSPSTRPDHLVLRRVVGHRRTHHVHALLPTSDELEGYLLLRDYLRADAAAADAYGVEKVRLAAAHPDDSAAYAAAKPAVVAGVMDAAREWAARTGWSCSLGR